MFYIAFTTFDQILFICISIHVCIYSYIDISKYLHILKMAASPGMKSFTEVMRKYTNL